MDSLVPKGRISRHQRHRTFEAEVSACSISLSGQGDKNNSKGAIAIAVVHCHRITDFLGRRGEEVERGEVRGVGAIRSGPRLSAVEDVKAPGDCPRPAPLAPQGASATSCCKPGVPASFNGPTS